MAGIAIFYGWMVSPAEEGGRFTRTDIASMQAYFGLDAVERWHSILRVHLSVHRTLSPGRLALLSGVA